MKQTRISTISLLVVTLLASVPLIRGAAQAGPRLQEKTEPGSASTPQPQQLASGQVPEIVNDWPQLQRDPQHTGYSPETINPPFTSTPYLWRWLDGYGPAPNPFPSGGVPSGYSFSGMAQPIVADGKVFIGSMTGHVNAIDAVSGQTVWRVATSGRPILHTLAYDSGVVYAGSTDHNLYAFNAVNGALIWSYETGGAISGAVVIYKSGSETYILVGSSDKYVYALRPDRTLRWRYKAGGPILSTPAVGYVDGRAKIFFGAEDMYAYALDLNGNLLWRSPAKLYGASFRNFWPVVSEAYNLVFFTTQYPFFNGEFGYWGTMDAFLSCLEQHVPPVGGDAEMSAILNGYADCSSTGYIGLNPDHDRRTAFALRTSDGSQPFVVPITHFSTNGNTHVSPIVGPDGSIYAYYHVWDRTVFQGQSYASRYSPDLSRINPTNGFRIPVIISDPITTISIQMDNVPVAMMGGSTIITLHASFQSHYINVNGSQPAGQPDAGLWWVVTDRNGWVPRFAWYQWEGNWEFKPENRRAFSGEGGGAIGPGHRLYINADGGMLMAIQATP